MKRRALLAVAGAPLLGVCSHLRRAEALTRNDIVYFEPGKWEVNSGRYGTYSLATIREAAQEIRTRRVLNVLVQGYTDTVGDAASNLLLSERRADAVRLALLAEGVQAGITTQGLGETGLAVPTPDNTPELRNRRAVVIMR